jgi:hypothetical protein
MPIAGLIKPRMRTDQHGWKGMDPQTLEQAAAHRVRAQSGSHFVFAEDNTALAKHAAQDQPRTAQNTRKEKNASRESRHPSLRFAPITESTIRDNMCRSCLQLFTSVSVSISVHPWFRSWIISRR